MAFGGFSDNKHMAPMADINVTPMVDVMLVLLVIFIITAPLFTHAIKLELPKTQAGSVEQKPSNVILSIDAAGAIFWDQDKSPLTLEQLQARLASAAKLQPPPDIQLRADKATRYEVLAHVMAAAQQNGLPRLSFVTEPEPAPAPKAN